MPVPASADLDEAVVVVVLRGNPYTGEAADAVDDVRDRLHRVDPEGLLGGIPAENFDIENTNARDTQLIVPVGPARRRADPRPRSCARSSPPPT